MKEIIKKQFNWTNIIFLAVGLAGWIAVGSFVCAMLFFYILITIAFEVAGEYHLQKFVDTIDLINDITGGKNASNMQLLDNKDKIREELKKSNKHAFWNQAFSIGSLSIGFVHCLILGIFFLNFFINLPENAELFMKIMNISFSLVFLVCAIVTAYNTIKTLITFTIPHLAKHKTTSVTLDSFITMIESNKALQTTTTTAEIREKYNMDEPQPSEVDVLEMMKDMLPEEEVEAMRKREAFAKSYCEEQGWSTSFTDLSMEQIMEIRQQEGWKNA